jgi:hypothetical protein
MNPIDAIEPLFFDFTGPAYSYPSATTSALAPGASIEIPANPQNGVWVNAETDDHEFVLNLWQSIQSSSTPARLMVQGSFHYDSSVDQREDAVVDVNSVIFTSLSEIQAFNLVGPDFLYIGYYNGLAFAFSSRGRLYEQADLYHYLGKALYSVNITQLINDASDFNPTLVVSNSLPIWLNMPNYVPPYPTFTCPIPLYPSYLVDDNLPPPFGSIHVESTTSLSVGSLYNPRMSSSQLCRDEVVVHLYGCDNLMAQDFLAFVEQYSYDWMTIGFANCPAIRDEKHPQPEFKILSQRKCINFEVNYLQSASRDIARQFIEHVKVQFLPNIPLVN